MSIARTQIESWNPSQLNDIAEAWDTLGGRLEGYFGEYVNDVTKVHGDYWEGKTADAAQQKAKADRRVVQDLVDQLNGVGKRLQSGYWEVNAPLQDVRGTISEAEGAPNGFRVADSLQITDPKPNPDASRAKALGDLQSRLTDAANRLESADNAVKDAVNKAKDSLRAAFTQAATLGAEQGKADAQQLATNPAGMTPEEYQRLITSSKLTPQQLDALKAGNIATIPASQMEYLNQVARSLDGKSPQEISAIMDKMPPDARQALANTMQIVSNPNVSAGVTDSDLPNNGKGGFSLLPKKMQDSLNRKDLVTKGTSAVKYDPTEDPLAIGFGVKETHLNGVADNQAIAKIAGAADPRYRMGSDLDNKVLDVGSQYLHGQVDADQHGRTLQVDGQDSYGGQPISEPMFSSVGDDKAAVANLVDPGGKPDDGFMHDVLTHQWADHGQAASTLFKFNDGDAIVTDPNNAAQVATATHQGQIMSAVGEYTSKDDSWKQLANLGDHQSVGQVNPDLVRTMSHSMAPYLGQLADSAGPDQTRGFSTYDGDKHWIDPDNHDTYHGSKNAFSFMDTDGQAGKEFNATAMGGMLADEAAYGHNPNDPHAADYLNQAGRLDGLVDGGLRDESQNQTNNQHDAAIAAYDQKKEAYESIKNLASFGAGEVPGPTGELLDSVDKITDSGGDSLKESIIGQDPRDTDKDTATLQGPDPAHSYYDVLSNTQISPTLEQQHNDLFENGHLKSWSELTQQPGSTDELERVFNKVGDTGDGHGQALLNAYDQVTRKDG